MTSPARLSLTAFLALAPLLVSAATPATAPGAAQVADAPEDSGFINAWLVAGPFAVPVGAEKVASSVGASLSGKKWEFFDDRLWNRNYDNYQDLSGYYAVRKGVDTRNKFVYAAVSVFSPAARTADFRYGASGTDRVFLNGSEIARDDKLKEVQRDMRKVTVSLKKGWNRLLLEIRHDFTDDVNGNGAPVAKDAAVSYLGFYGRVTDAEGRAIPGVLYSTVGDAKTLALDVRALAADDVVAAPGLKGRGLPVNALPVGYTEWPYVWNKSFYGRDQRRIWADPYRLRAGGGAPGYRFSIVAGALPDGVTLREDGTLAGFCAKTGEFAFTVRVTDAAGKTAESKLSITVRDRPNRWFEEGRVGALSHCPVVYPFWVDANYSADLWAERAKRQGHSLVSIEALQQNYYWPSKFEDPKHPRNQYQPRDKAGRVLDGLRPFADAVKRYGMQFGLYYATEGGGLGHFSTDVFVQNCSDLIRRYDPAYLYFDGPQAMKGANYDVMYSNVRNYGDDIIINSNVWAGNGEYGDADLGTSEASHIYANAGPVHFNKRITVEPWKSVVSKNNPTPYYAKRDDFRQIVKEMVMNAGRGYVDNNDQMPLMSRGPNWDSPADIAKRYPVAIQEFSDIREGTAGWWAPFGLPERHESTTGTVPYFLSGCGYEDDGKDNIAAFAAGKGPSWGYATARDNTVYLHFIQGPDGKKGLPAEKTVSVSPIRHRVRKVTLLNTDKPLKFTQDGDKLTVSLDGVTADPVDTIVKIVTDNPARKYKLTDLVATGRQFARDALKVEVEGHMTYPALKVPFAPGALRFTSDNPAVAKVDETGRVHAVAPGRAGITVEGEYEGVTARDTLPVVVDAAKNIRVGGELIGAVLRLSGKEAYLAHAGTGALPYALEGRSKKGGPVSLHTAKVVMKCGVVDYAKGTPYHPVFIGEKSVFSFNAGALTPAPVKELTRTAVWAEVELDGAKFTTNKVFVDLEPWAPVSGAALGTRVTDSGHLADFTPDRTLDGGLILRDGSDRAKWSAPGNSPSWIAYDLGKPTKVSRVEIHFNTLDQHYINTPEVMEIQTSADGVNWTTVATAKPPGHGAGAYYGYADTFRFRPTAARHFRLNFPKGGKGESVDLPEVRFGADLTNNLALLARASASSSFNDSYAPAFAIDGVFGETGSGEWASQNESDPWIRLDWDGKVALNRIVLRDRPNPSDHLAQGVLTFSDGTKVEVTGIPNDGAAKTVTFPAKSVTWVKFEGKGNKPGNNGLAEFEAYGRE